MHFCKKSNIPMAKLFFLTILSVCMAHIMSGTAFSEPLTISPARIDNPPVIDGILDDPCWETSPKGNNFTVRSYGHAASEPTEFHACYDDENFYFGIYCFDSSPDDITALQTERDGFMLDDDLIWISLDTYHTHITCDQFFVNAIGTQRDTRSRGTANKVEWKGDWIAEVSIVDDGYIVEVAIPLSILNYQAGTTSMGFNIHRKIRRLDETSEWSHLENGGKLEQYGDLECPDLPAPTDSPLQFMPFVKFEVSEDYSKGRIGADIKKQFCGDNNILISLFPDFGTIEQAVKSIDYTYTQHRYMDNRPFFLEARSIFDSSYVYTTSIPDFDYGVKLFGKREGLDYGIMHAVKAGERSDSMLVAKMEMPKRTNVKLMMISRDDESMNNKVFVASGTTEIANDLNVWVRGAKSLTSGADDNGTDFRGGMWYSHNGIFLDFGIGQISRNFNPGSGYVDYPGSTHWSTGGSYWRERPGKTIRGYGFNAFTGASRDNERGLIYRFTDTNLWADFSNHSSFYINHNWGPHIANYNEDDPSVDYYWNSDRMTVLSLRFRTDDQYREYGINYREGRIAGGPTRGITAHCGFKPWKDFSTNFQIKRVSRNNPEEGEITLWQGIMSVRYEFTPEKSLSARILHQEEGTNFTLCYRQQVRKGLDIFALYGDYNSEKTVNKLSVKLVAAI